jgi:hypothetical protein
VNSAMRQRDRRRHGESGELTAVRSYLLALIGAALTGLETELVLMNHSRTPLQLVPLGLAGAGMAVVATLWIFPVAAAVRFLKAILWAGTLAGALGIVVHWQSNPGDHRREAPPLVPAMMLPLGLLGSAYAFRHPALSGRAGGTFRSVAARPGD